MPTYHVYRNGRLAGLTVPPPTTPMWPGSPIDRPDHFYEPLSLDSLIAEPRPEESDYHRGALS